MNMVTTKKNYSKYANRDSYVIFVPGDVYRAKKIRPVDFSKMPVYFYHFGFVPILLT